MVVVKPMVILSIAGSLVWNIATAEVLYKVIAPALTGVTLFDQQLDETGLVTIKPTVLEAKGDAFVMDQCLWSINVDLDADLPTFSAGKMICVGPNQEVLESVPLGEIEAFGDCVDAKCSSLKVAGDQKVNMILADDLEFSLQPRNERK